MHCVHTFHLIEDKFIESLNLPKNREKFSAFTSKLNKNTRVNKYQKPWL